jgi:hypothetical protein
MIRIEEIYANTLWAYIRRYVPRTRFWFLDPPGHVGIEYLRSYAPPGGEFNYVLAFDQEPVEISRLRPIIDHIVQCEESTNLAPGTGAIITSEYNSATVARLCALNNWKSFYYFYNGWAALDWFRGYNRSYLLEPYADRTIKHTFISPNRIIAGERLHRLILMYHLVKNDLAHNRISFPLICPAENVTVYQASETLLSSYPDIHQVFAQVPLPLQLETQVVPSYASATLSLQTQSSECLVYVVNETVGSGIRQHLTEKTFQPICMQMPFVLASTAHSLGYLRKYGFETFHSVWDESYDTETDDHMRMQRIAELLRELEHTDKQKIHQQCQDIVMHNYNHFYNGGFEARLWQELESVLHDIQTELFV